MNFISKRKGNVWPEIQTNFRPDFGIEQVFYDISINRCLITSPTSFPGLLILEDANCSFNTGMREKRYSTTLYCDMSK